MTTEIMDIKHDVNTKCTNTSAAEKKKQGKFQTFRKLFGKKRKKVPPTFAEKLNLKSSHSSGDVRNGIGSATEESEDELRSTSTGTRALSHDSIFIPAGSSSNRAAAQVTSRKTIPGKVRTLQHQLERNIKFGQPLQTLTVKKMENTRANSEVDGFSRSALEECTQREFQLPGSGLKVPQARSSRPASALPSASSGGTIESINLDAVPQSMSRLDNTAAKHKLSVKPRNQRISKKHGRLSLSLDMQNVTVHEFEYELEEKVHIRVENGQKHYNTAEGNKKEEKGHQKYEEQRCREEAKKYKWQEDQTQYEFAEQKRLEDGQGQEAQRVHKQAVEEQKVQEEEQRRREMEEQKLREEEQRRREIEEQKLREEEQRQREMEEQKLREEEQRRREMEEQKLREEEQRQREMEEQKLREEEQRRREIEDQNLREEEQRQREIEDQKLREEEQRQREMEDQKLREEEQRRREMEDQKLREEEQRQREMEEQKLREEEQRRREMEEQKLREEEQRRREMEDQKLREEEQRRREIEDQKLREEEQRRQEVEEQKVGEEEQRQREMEEQKLREEEQRRREMEEQKLREEEQRQREMEEQKLREEEQRCQEVEQKVGEEEQRQEVKEEKLNEKEQQCHEVKEEKVCELEERVCEEEKQNRKLEKQYHEIVDLKTEKEVRCLKTKEIIQSQEKEKICFSATGNKQSHEETQRKDLEKQKQQKIKKQSDLQNRQRVDEERQNDGKVISQEEQQSLEALEEEQRREELRWKELDERQTTSQPFSFQVASGEKQIIFPKVNLTPVTHPRETVPSLDTNILHSSSKSSKGLSSSSYVPHTAILVTGAQLCGTAVDLKQIKDTACKSLLGFSEEKKADLPFIERTSKSNPDMRNRIGKSKFNPGQSLDQSRALTEWATIRAKILKSSNERLQEKERRVHGRFSDDWTAYKVSNVHGSLRKTLSANAKFSITPAWQKWADGNKVNDGDKVNIFHEKEKQNTPDENVPVANSTMDSSESSRSLGSGDIAQDVTKDIKGGSHSENHNIRITDAAEGCKFAKDLPSFLVPSLPATSRKEHSLPQAQLPIGNRAVTNVTSQTEGMMDTSPFGIKLRRTHYSLRFHYEQQGEQKRKKRYSAGDSMEGIPAFLAAKEKEGESCTVSEKPILQSRHSLDSSRLVDKVESAQPLWITLAMQKQKGFREQQASREERRQAREAKIAEKLIKENITVSSTTDIKAGTHYISTLKKSTQDEEKKIGTNIVSKVERREHLKKSATLPTSVTVEICDSVASIPPVKELPKRFSTPEAAPVSVEPAWLALAKRKAKAWSDCPQIIK
ncbi:capping protein inhibiting regulator of actin dynamics isoform X2 [Pristis pectinata]|uniref:capping protein inhibiting regulator of actin dynamics isoform X2 n=1 Tax=Pristis pectinata TaxID=685728 RepID=UPI00223CB3E8|nr:capping protein inhibiting regulator of actin dynamics isoform X2 [Pristis pectinata]